MPFTRRRRRGYYAAGGGGGGPVTVLSDNFNRTTTTDPGSPQVGGPYSGFTTYFKCDGTKLVNSQNSAYYYLLANVGASNFTLQFTISLAATALTGFMWRAAADGSSYLAFSKNDDTHWYIFMYNAGADTNYFAETVQVGDGDVIKIVCSGNDSAIYRNGVLILTHTDATTAGNTYTGPNVRTSSLAAGSHGWEDLSVTVP